MDISSITSMYTDLYSTNSQSATKLENQLSGDLSTSTDDELMEVCKEFEAYFLEQMFKAMMETIPESEETSSYASTMKEYCLDEMVQQLASDATQNSSLGLAQTLYEQMKRNYDL